MFDFLGESGVDKAVLNKSPVFDDTLLLCLKELQLLDQVRIVLVELAILMDVSKESPVVEVIGGPVTPEAMMEPGGEGFQWFVRCVIGRGI